MTFRIKALFLLIHKNLIRSKVVTLKYRTDGRLTQNYLRDGRIMSGSNF
jgi:hypothetical protein